MPAPVRHILRICRAEFCRSKGCDLLIEHVEALLGARLGETTADGSFALEAVYCIGNCANSPALLLDGKPYGPVSVQVADLLIEEVRRRGGLVRAIEAEKQVR